MITGLIGMGINNEYINQRVAKAATESLMMKMIKFGLKVNQAKNNLNFADDVQKETARKEAEYFSENDLLKAVMSGKVDLSKLSPEARQKAELMLKYKQ